MNPKGTSSWVTSPLIQSTCCLDLVLCRCRALGVHSSGQQLDDQRAPFLDAKGCQGRYGAVLPLHEPGHFRGLEG